MIRNIQLLRGLAAMLVVLCHATWFWGGSLRWLQQYSFAAGFTGVDLFFVISGYVISRVATSNRKKAGNLKAASIFAFNRVARIYPIYWVTLIVSMALAWLITGSIMGGKEVDFFRMIILKTHNPLVSVTWTLVYEVYFYFLVTVLLALSPWDFRKTLLVFALAYACLLVGVQVFGIHGPVQTRPIILDFLFGILVFLYLDRFGPVPAKVTVAIGTVGVLFGTYLMMGDPWGKNAYRAYALGIPSAILLAGMISLEKTWSAPTFFVALGDASYSIYLWHGLILHDVRQLKIHIEPSLISVAIALVSMALLGWLSWMFIEKPIAKAVKKLRVLIFTRPAPVGVAAE